MTDGHSAAIHVHFVEVEPEFTGYAQRLNRKCFIEFVEIDVFVLPSGLFPDFSNRINRNSATSSLRFCSTSGTESVSIDRKGATPVVP